MARIAQFALCVSAAVSAADVSQLRGRQPASPVDALEDCDVCHHDLYTGYNHEQSGEPSGWQEEEAIQGVNAWWLCAEKCSRKSGCDGWTFAYKGDGPPYKCYLKSGTKPRSRWTTDYNVISGLPLSRQDLNMSNHANHAEPTLTINARWPNVSGSLYVMTTMVSPISKNGDVLPPNELIVDTGSSTVAFCDVPEDFSQRLSSLMVGKNNGTYSVFCNSYGDSANGPLREGFWSPLYRGSLKLGDFTVPDANFGIMKEYRGMTCFEGIKGIFGFGFNEMNNVHTVASLPNWDKYLEKGLVGSCPLPTTGTSLPVNFQSFLKSEAKPDKFGIYWNGQMGSGVGSIYTGEAAVSNKYYAYGGTNPQTAGIFNVGRPQYYMGAASFQFGDDDVINTFETGLIDSGTSRLHLPLKLRPETNESVTVTITLVGKDKKPSATLKFPFAEWLRDGTIKFVEGPWIFGMSIWKKYYTVFDLTNDQIEFTELQP